LLSVFLHVFVFSPPFSFYLHSTIFDRHNISAQHLKGT
jgi:hypothetical protein